MPYRVDWSGLLRQRLQQLATDATAAGHGPAFLEGMKRLFARLGLDPYDAGEIMYHTAAGDPVFVACSGPLAINFTIFEALQAVCILRAERLAGPMEGHSS